MPPRILFLDDDPVIRVLRMVLSNREHEPWMTGYFAPEVVNFTRLIAAANGLRTSDGASIGLATESTFEDASIIYFRRGEVDRAMVDRHPNLRFIQRLGERPDGIDLAAAAGRGIAVSCLPRRTLLYTAEHAVMLMLALGKRLFAADRAVRDGAGPTPGPGGPGSIVYNWPALDATGLYGRTLGIVGMGEVGYLLAKLAHAFGMSLLYTKRRRASAAQEAAVGAQFLSENELLSRSDYVALLLPNIPALAGYASDGFFARMRPDAFFINVSRGALVNEDALHRALVAGTIAGAGLDVHACEPRAARDRIAVLDNVILTPHVAGGAKSGLLDEFEVMVANTRAVLEGRRPRFMPEGMGG